MNFSKEEYWFIEPDGIPEELYEHVSKFSCYGVPFIIVHDKGEDEVRIFSPTIVALLLCEDISKGFWNSKSKEIPLTEIVDAYRQGYIKGYSEGISFLQNTYLSKSQTRTPVEITKEIYQLGREYKKEAYCPVLISEFSIYNAGYNTGRTVAMSNFIHKKKDWYKEAFNIELACTSDKPIFENFEPIKNDRWVLSKLQNGKAVLPKHELVFDSITQEKQRIAIAAWHKQHELSLLDAKELAKKEANLYNETTGEMIKKKLHPLQYADFHASNYLKSTFEFKLVIDKKNKNAKGSLTLNTTYTPPSYITPQEYFKFQGYIMQQYEQLQNNGQSISGKEEKKSTGEIIKFLTEEGVKIIDFILKNYHKAKPKNIAALLFALNDLGMCGKPNQLDQTELVKALQADLKVDFSRQGLNKAINNFDRINKEHLIKATKKSISNYLATLATK